MSKITKIAKIDNFGIFKNFDWDSSLSHQNKKGENEVYNFKDINIFYGRNYSGKTSLSKIIRALEIKSISSKYENPNFRIKLHDDSEITPSNLSNFQHPIHVYNSDFVKENLRFIHDENADIESFSVTLGGDNQQILERIQELKTELGSNEENAEYGLSLKIKHKRDELDKASKAHQDVIDLLDAYLKSKASGNPESIRSQPNLFGDQEYNIGKLKRIDIPLVLSLGYQPLDYDKEQEYRNILVERELTNPPVLATYNLDFRSLVTSTNDILKSVVGSADKIDELKNNPSLNSWVQIGHPLHSDRTTCAFCNNEISGQRLKELASHFDEETDKLRDRISKGIQYLDKLLSNSQLNITIDMTNYYQQYHPELSQLQTNLQNAFAKQKSSIELLKKSLEDKDKKLFSELSIEHPQDHSAEIITILERISQIRTECIQKKDKRSSLQNEAKNALRLDHIYHFLQSINYTQLTSDIELTSQAITPLKEELAALENRKISITAEIKSEEDKLKSEGEACRHINEILQHDFGHQHLSLEPIETTSTNSQSIKFEIQRLKNGIKTKAHNLSEGECSLISFCYFLAKVQESLSSDQEPIIWIDDPICSLDSNHIFFIYSLINEKICLQGKYSQLFISTHNLDFLKYLKRLNTKVIRNGKNKELQVSKYLVSREETFSQIYQMPKYLSEYSTEFNYLFKQIYTCAITNILTDENYSIFYNFSNNARKFIEIYSFFKFPTYYKYDDDRLKAFWNDEIYRLFIGRVNNEYSHCSGVLERGMSLMEVPEMHQVAKAIIQKVKKDTQQYTALLESLNIDIANDPLSISSPTIG